MARKLLLTLAALALASLALVACGDDSGDTTTAAAPAPATTTDTGADTGADTGGGGGSGGSSAITTTADPGGALEYTSGDLTAEAGEVTLTFENPSSIPHDTRVEDSSGSDVGGTDVISESTAETTLQLEPGTYTYYCSVGSHREIGMEASLTVK